MIRLMDLSDYDAVVALWQKTPGVGMRREDDSRQGVARFLRRNPRSCFVALVDKKLVGAILCGHDGRRGHIYHACVDEAHRREGVGRALVQAALDSLAEEGIRKASLVTYGDNERAKDFWKALHWTQRKDLSFFDVWIDSSGEE